jgi:putative DNA primase/helicase
VSSNGGLTNIPAELRELEQWVIWRPEDRDGKATKVPHCARPPHWRASSVDPETWARFTEAAHAAEAEAFGGVGFVFTADDPYTGIDLDACRDPETGHVDLIAVDIVEMLDGYVEISPSGTGLQVIVKAKLAPDCRHRGVASWGGQLEIYDCARFFTMTGERWTAPSTTWEVP